MSETGSGSQEVPVPLLNVSDLHVAYRAGVRAVNGVSLSLSAGETVAVVGESGSGKSTMAHAVIGLLPEGGRVLQGQVLFQGRDLAAMKEKELQNVRGRGIGLIPQDPTVSLNPVKRIGDQVAEVLLIHHLADKRGAALKTIELLEEVGLPDAAIRARQYPHQLSGGMRQRVLIAIALAARPRLVIADEPTSALDVTVQRRILDLLEDLTQKMGMALLLITHDLGVAADRAHRVVVMSRGEIVEGGPTDVLLSSAVHPVTRVLISSAPALGGPRGGVDVESISRRRATGLAAESVENASHKSCRPPGAPQLPDLVVAEHLTKEFGLPRVGHGPTVLRAVDDVSFSIARGETYALVGESGSGKSTASRLVLRLSSPTSGRVFFAEEDINKLSDKAMRQLRRRMQIIYQNPYASLDPRFTIAEVVEEPLRVFKQGDRRSRAERARELLERVALPPSILTRRPSELSGGQRQRVAIARALSLEPDFLVCDEVVSALDVSVQRQVLDLLIDLQMELGLTLLFISHDLSVVARIADRVGVMCEGRLVETGTAAEVLSNPQDRYTQEFVSAIPGRRRSHSTTHVTSSNSPRPMCEAG